MKGLEDEIRNCEKFILGAGKEDFLDEPFAFVDEVAFYFDGLYGMRRNKNILHGPNGLSGCEQGLFATVAACFVSAVDFGFEEFLSRECTLPELGCVVRSFYTGRWDVEGGVTEAYARARFHTAEYAELVRCLVILTEEDQYGHPWNHISFGLGDHEGEAFGTSRRS
jgi:hypothetical protein